MPGDESSPATDRLQPSLASHGTVPRALLGSLLLHGAIGIGLWHFDRVPAATTVAMPPGATPIELRFAALPAPPLVEPTAPPEPVDTTVPESVDLPEPPPREKPDTQPPERTAADTRSGESQQPGEAAPSAAESPPEEAIEREPLVPAGVDLEAVRRQAVARVVASLRERAQQRTFSFEDLPGEPADTGTDDGAPAIDIFEAAAAVRRDGILTRGRARSRVVRNVVELCNQLTGGFSLFGLANVCADPAAPADLFGHLRPEYMERVPLCAAEEELLVDVEQTGAGAVGELKCVLVPREIRADYYSRFDPALAGWLPAEEDSASAADP